MFWPQGCDLLPGECRLLQPRLHVPQSKPLYNLLGSSDNFCSRYQRLSQTNTNLTIDCLLLTFSCPQNVDLSPVLHGTGRRTNLHTCWFIHGVRQNKQVNALKKSCWGLRSYMITLRCKTWWRHFESLQHRELHELRLLDHPSCHSD